MSAPPPTSPDLDAFKHHWQDEADAAFLYRLLSDAEPDARKKDLYRRLAEVEDQIRGTCAQIVPPALASPECLRDLLLYTLHRFTSASLADEGSPSAE